MKIHWNFAFVFLSSLCLTKLTLAAIEDSKCPRNNSFDTEQTLFAQDFGPDGTPEHLNVTLNPRIQVGAVISVVTKSDVRGSINLIADDIYVLHIDARIQEGKLVIATSRRLNLEWNPNMLTLPNPVVKDAKTTTMIVYEAKGYRIFINGREIAFYEHRSNKVPQVLRIAHSYLYKIVYLTTRKTGEL